MRQEDHNNAAAELHDAKAIDIEGACTAHCHHITCMMLACIEQCHTATQALEALRPMVNCLCCGTHPNNVRRLKFFSCSSAWPFEDQLSICST
jgi:hypothetical protein